MVKVSLLEFKQSNFLELKCIEKEWKENFKNIDQQLEIVLIDLAEIHRKADLNSYLVETPQHSRYLLSLFGIKKWTSIK